MRVASYKLGRGPARHIAALRDQSDGANGGAGVPAHSLAIPDSSRVETGGIRKVVGIRHKKEAVELGGFWFMLLEWRVARWLVKS